jgi:hypothetical protein
VIAIRTGVVTDNKIFLAARMDNAEVRTAYITLRVAELRVLACKTAIEYWRERQQRELTSRQLQLPRRGDGQRRE